MAVPLDLETDAAALRCPAYHVHPASSPLNDDYDPCAVHYELSLIPRAADFQRKLGLPPVALRP